MRWKGSIHTEKIKNNHQDIRYHLIYQKGGKNCADFLSRHAISWNKIPKQQKEEADELVNTLYIFSTPDAIGVKKIAEETAKDPVLSKLKKLLDERH